MRTISRLLFPKIENALRLRTAIQQEGTRVFIDWNVDGPGFDVDGLDFAVLVQDPRDPEPRLVGRFRYEPVTCPP